MNIPGYDEWKLSTPWDDCHQVGTEEGQQCGRYHEPDEDAPRGYRPKPCNGEILDQDGLIVCNVCGEIAE